MKIKFYRFLVLLLILLNIGCIPSEKYGKGMQEYYTLLNELSRYFIIETGGQIDYLVPDIYNRLEDTLLIDESHYIVYRYPILEMPNSVKFEDIQGITKQLMIKHNLKTNLFWQKEGDKDCFYTKNDYNLSLFKNEEYYIGWDGVKYNFEILLKLREQNVLNLRRNSWECYPIIILPMIETHYYNDNVIFSSNYLENNIIVPQKNSKHFKTLINTKI